MARLTRRKLLRARRAAAVAAPLPGPRRPDRAPAPRHGRWSAPACSAPGRRTSCSRRAGKRRPDRRLGPGPCPRLVGRRIADDPGGLRAGRGLYPHGGPVAAGMAGAVRSGGAAGLRTRPASCSSSASDHPYATAAMEVHRRLGLSTAVARPGRDGAALPGDRFHRRRIRPVRARFRRADGAPRGADPGAAEFVRAGGQYRRGAGGAAGRRRRPARRDRGPRRGERIGSAEQFVFAAGPWLPRLFPDILGRRIRATRQEVFFFAPPGRRPALPARRAARLGRFQRRRPLLRHAGPRGARLQDRLRPAWAGGRSRTAATGRRRREMLARRPRLSWRGASRRWPTRRSTRRGSANMRTARTAIS